MSESPERCPTCSTAVPAGADRCPACGRVFGEANRCPHCHAVAGVLRRGSRTVCAACGKPRAGSVVLGRAADHADGGTRAMLGRARGRGQRAFGVLALGAGVLAAIAAAILVPGAAGIGIAVLGGALGVGIGALSMRAGARAMSEAEREDAREVERRLLTLAQSEKGSLTATRAAQELGLSVSDADAALTRMVGDGSRIDVDVDDEGRLTYVFRELLPRGARVRVELPEGEPAEPALAERGEEEASEDDSVRSAT